VLYLLHGFPGRPLAFLTTVQMGIVDDALTAKHRAQPLILVMPFGSTSTFTDEEWVNGAVPGNHWGTFVSRDLVRFVGAHFRTIASAKGRAIAGLSEGGYGAIDIALHHPREFSVVQSWSRYMRPDKLRSIFGSELRLVPANDPRLLLPQFAPQLRRSGRTGSTRLDRPPAEPERRLRASSRLHIAHRYRLVYGGHNWAIWRNNARNAYLSAAARLARG
jgi:S-formylglutathione hydrolase FrmB